MVEVMLRIIMVRGQLGFMARLGFGSDKGQMYGGQTSGGRANVLHSERRGRAACRRPGVKPVVTRAMFRPADPSLNRRPRCPPRSIARTSASVDSRRRDRQADTQRNSV